MKNVVICGDSFCAPDGENLGYHFSELIQANTVILSRQGASNGAIFLQLSEALNLNPDIIIYGITDPSRMIVPNPKSRKNIWNSPNVLKNIRYSKNDGYPTQNEVTIAGDDGAPFISHTIDMIMNHNSIIEESPELKDAVKKFFVHIFDHDMQDWFDKEMFKGYEARAKVKGIKMINLHETCPFLNIEAANYKGKFSHSFHTSDEVQKKVVEVLDKIIME
jgi:hypothetical protein